MTRRFAPPLIAVLVFVVTLAWGGSAARADATIDASSVEPQYPKTLNFKVTASAPADITDVRLVYAITGRGASAIAIPDEVAKGKTVSVTVAVQTNSGSSYIAPGSDFTYHWEIASADGKTTVTKDQQYRYLPPGKDWQSVSGEIMQVFYYGDRKALADSYLKAGQETFDKIGKQLLNTQLKITPVKVLLFAVESELEQAKPGAGAGGRFDAAVTTCGTKVTDDIVFVIPQACGSNDRTDTLRHEFGHIINAAAGEGTLAKLPSWLDEGTAVYAQTDPGSNYVGAFLAAVRANRLLPFSSMGVASSTASQVNLFYGQSYGMVKYLIDKAGPAKYAEFFATIKKGSRFDQALQQVYGFDLAGFEQEFTTNGGQVRGASSAPPAATVAPTQAPPRQTSPTAAATQRPRAATSPTVVPTAAPAAKSNGSGDKSISTETVAIVGAAVLFALLAVLAFLVTMVLQNNRTRGGGSAGAPPAEPF